MTFKKKLTRKQFLTQPDEFMTITASITNYIRNQGRVVTVGLGSVLAIGLIVGIAYLFQSSKQNEANLLESAAYRTYHGQVQGEKSPSGAGGPIFNSKEELYKAAKTKYQEIIDRYPGTPNARRALLYIGNCAHGLGEYEQAQKAYQEFLDATAEDDAKYREALRSLGYSQEEAGQYQKAAATYQRTVDLAEGEGKLLPYLDLARVYEQAKDWKQAVSTYESMLTHIINDERRKVVESKLYRIKKKGEITRNQVKLPEMEVITESSETPR